MSRTRTFRLVATAVVFAFVLTLAGLPGVAGAAPARGVVHRSAPSGIKAATVVDDDIPGVVRTLPFSYSDTLSALDADDPLDADDVSTVHLEKDQRLVATLTVDPDAQVYVLVYGPSVTSIFGPEYPLAVSYGDEVLVFIAPAAGDYHIDVWADGPYAAEPGEYEAYAGWAGSYTLDAEAITPATTSIGIRTAATTTYWGKTVTLSGPVAPVGVVGKVIVAYVMKPGKSYWTYSSNRVAYLLNGNGAWQYKYYFKPGMTKGYYKYKAVVPNYLYFKTSTSPNTVTIRLR